MSGFNQEQDRQKILELVAEYCRKYHTPKPYKRGDRTRYAGRVYGEEEMTNLVSSSLDFWLTSGKYTEEFEREFSKLFGVKSVSVVNSVSSANFAAFITLASPLLGE